MKNGKLTAAALPRYFFYRKRRAFVVKIHVLKRYDPIKKIS